jgi:hypothetical protein
MATSIQESTKYQLIKPYAWSRFGGTKVLKEQIVLNGQVENFELVQSFATFLEVIVFMCLNAKHFGARLEPDLYHLRVTTHLRNINKQFIEFNEFKIVACAKTDPYDPKQLSFELDELSFDNYLQCKPITNICYRPKEDSWFKTIVNNLLVDDDEDLAFERPFFKPITDQTLQEMVNKAVKQIFDPEYELAYNTPSSNTSQFSVINMSQSAGLVSNVASSVLSSETALQSSNNLNRYVSYSQQPEPQVEPQVIEKVYEGIVVEDETPLFEEGKITHQPRPKSKLNVKNLLFGAAAVGLLSWGMLPTLNNNSFSTVKQATLTKQTKQVAAKIDIKPTVPLRDTKAQIKTYDEVIGTYISQDDNVCAKLQEPPKAINYGDNQWFAKDNSKFYLCQIGTVEKQSKALTGTALDTYKAANSTKVMNAITKSKDWLKMST